MRERIASDSFLADCFWIARELHVTLHEVRRMDLSEFNGWISWLEREQEAQKAHG